MITETATSCTSNIHSMEMLGKGMMHILGRTKQMVEMVQDFITLLTMVNRLKFIYFLISFFLKIYLFTFGERERNING